MDILLNQIFCVPIPMTTQQSERRGSTSSLSFKEKGDDVPKITHVLFLFRDIYKPCGILTPSPFVDTFL